MTLTSHKIFILGQAMELVFKAELVCGWDVPIKILLHRFRRDGSLNLIETTRLYVAHFLTFFAQRIRL